MADDIKVKFTADGSSYNKQIKELTQQNKTLKSEVDKVKSSTDQNTTAQEKAAKVAEAIRKQVKSQEETIKALKAEYDRLSTAEGDNTATLMKQEEKINKAEIALNKMNGELADAQREADGYGAETEEATEQTTKMDEAARVLAASKLAEFYSKVSEEVQKVAAAAYDAAKELDEGYDTIIKKTGATGDALGDLQKSADKVFGRLPADMSDVGTAIGEVNTRFGLTGEQLEDVSELFIKFADITDTDVNTAIGTTSRLLKTYGGNVSDADKVLGYFAKQSQQTGVDTNTLMSALDKSGATLREMGLDLQQSTKLLAMFEQNGVDSAGALAGLRKAVVEGAKQGKSFDQVISDTSKSIKNAASDTQALQIATELFGVRGAAIMADGIRSGRISLDGLTESMAAYGAVVGDTFEATLDPWDQAKIAMNNLKIAGSELAGEALSAIAPLLERVTDGIQKAVEWFKNLPEPVKKVVGMVGLLGAAFGVAFPKVQGLLQTISMFKAANAVKSLNGVKDAGESATSSLSGLAKGLGIAAGATVAAVAAIKAINEAVKKWRMENDEAYASAMKLADAMKEMSGEAESYGDYISDLKDEIEAESKMEMSAADRAKSAAKKYADVQGQRKEADKALIIAKQKLVQMLGSEEAAERALSIGQIKTASSGEALMRSLDGVFGRLTGNVDAYNEAVAAIQMYETENANADEVLSMLTQTMTENGYTLEEATALADGFGTEMGDMAGEVEVATEEVTDSFDDIYKAAKEDLQGTLNILEKWADEGALSMDEFAKIMAENAEAWENWDDNITTLTSDARYQTDRNFKSMVDTLIGMGAKGAKAIGDMATAVKNGDDATIKSWSDLAGKASWTRNNVTSHIASMQATTQVKANQMATDARNAMNNYAVALNNGADVVRQRAAKVKEAANSAKVNPAEFAAIGVDAVKRMASGISDSRTLLQNVAKQVAADTALMKTSPSTAKTWGADAIAALARGMSDERWQVRKVANIIAQDVKDRLGHSTPKLGPLHGDDQWGYHMVDNLIEGMQNSMRSLKVAAFDVAAAMANPVLTFGEGGINGKSVSNSLSYGDIVVNVNGANVQNDQQLASKISAAIFTEMKREQMAWA